MIITILLVCGCTSTKVQSSTTQSSITYSPTVTTKTPVPEKNINQDFSSIALTISDLPRGWMTSGTPIKNETMYQSEFLYIGSTWPIQLTFTLKKYSTVDDAKNIFQQEKSETTDVRVNALDIGKEGFGYEAGQFTGVVVRNGNLIISFSSQAYPPVKINDLSPYARLVNSRIIQ